MLSKFKTLFIILIVILLLSTSAFASEINRYGIDVSQINTSYSDILSYDFNFENLVEIIAKGEFDEVLSLILDTFKSNITKALGNHKLVMSTILGLLLLSGFQNMLFDDDFIHVTFLINITISGLLLSSYISMYNLAANTISDIVCFLKNALPAFLGISALVSVKSTYVNTVFIFSLTIFQWLCENVLLPGITIASVMSLIPAAGDNMKFSFIKNRIISVINWTIGIYSTLFIAALKIVQISALSTDKLLYGGIRYTISHGIPVVGGYVADSLGAVLGGIIAINNSVGIAASLIIVSIALVPVVSIFLMSFLLKLISGFGGIFAHSSSSNLIGDISACISELGVLVIVCSIGFVIAFSLMLSH